MLHDIFIPLESAKGGKDGQKAVARITEWPQGAKNPVGEVVEILGRPGENNTEMNAILADFGFATSYPREGITEAESIDGRSTERRVGKECVSKGRSRCETD